MSTWTYEHNVDNYVRNILTKGLKLKEKTDFGAQKDIVPYLLAALEGSSKTLKNQDGIPDFSVTKFTNIPVLIENKLHTKFLQKLNGNEIDFSAKSIQKYAVNGALHYARCVIASKKYKEAIAVGIAGDNEKNVEIVVYYVFSANEIGYKLTKTKNLNFLENQKTFNAFYKDAQLSETQKHEQLQRAKQKLNEQAKKLNSLMHSLSITAPQRVLYISGMLLAMQDILIPQSGLTPITQSGLTPMDLEGKTAKNKRDGVLITNQIKQYLKTKINDTTKLDLMLSAFNEISKDAQRDEPTQLNKLIAKHINGKASINKQIFTFIFEFIYKSIEGFSGHLDIMGEMYSEFLKYAMGDGKELGIVLTPPYVTKMMAEILEIDENSKVMDLATGSAGFLISAMQIMIDKAEQKYGKDSKKAKDKIAKIKANQLLGVELNAEMFVLASTNMILRGDGSSRIKKGNTFLNEDYYKEFKADRLLLNPPFTHEENGMPFIEIGLRNMPKGAKGAIIIQDSAGSGKAIKTNKEILKHNTLLASIKMPTDLFLPMAGVQTSIYVFEAGIPHDFDKVVKFIDFRNDGYKRTKRDLQEVDNPELKYRDILSIYKNGKEARLLTTWNLDECYVADYISDSGSDWNFEFHKKIDTKPTLNDFKKCVNDFLSWEISNIIKTEPKDLPSSKKLESTSWGEFRIGDLFDITNTFSFNKEKLTNGNQYDYITRTSFNYGILQSTGFINKKHLNEAGVWSLGLLQMDFFYRKRQWYAGQFVRKVIPKITLNQNAILFFTTLLNKQKNILLSVLVRDVDEIFKNIKIHLPITSSGEINFNFMDSFIKELENERLTEIKKYLSKIGLANTTLTKAEQNALNSLNFKIWQEFKIGDLFKKLDFAKLNCKKSDLPASKSGDFVLPAITCSAENNGISCYVKKNEATVFKNAISIAANGNAPVFYQSGEFTILQDAYVVDFKDKKLSQKQNLFFTAILRNVLKKFDWNNKSGWEKVKNEIISLPICDDGKIDFDFMENFIKALSKQSIKNIDAYLIKSINN